MKEKPFLSTTLCKVDRVLTLGQPPSIKVCYFPSPSPWTKLYSKNKTETKLPEILIILEEILFFL